MSATLPSLDLCRDLCGGWGIACLAHFLFLLRRYNVSRHDWRWGGLPIWIVVQWPTFKLGEVSVTFSVPDNAYMKQQKKQRSIQTT